MLKNVRQRKHFIEVKSKLSNSYSNVMNKQINTTQQIELQEDHMMIVITAEKLKDRATNVGQK